MESVAILRRWRTHRQATSPVHPQRVVAYAAAQSEMVAKLAPILRKYSSKLRSR